MIAGVFGPGDPQAGPCRRAWADTTPREMSRLIRDLQLVDACGRKYLATDERRHFLKVAARA